MEEIFSRRKKTRIKTNNNAKILYSLVFVFISFFILNISISKALASSLYLAPASGEYSAGRSFTLDLKLGSSGEFINAAQITIDFPADLLAAKSISKSGSIFSLWPEEPFFSNTQGTIQLSGGVPAPGFMGTGTLVRITFEGKKEGVAVLSLLNGSVLAADGKGTDTLKTLAGGTYKITLKSSMTELPVISSKTPGPAAITSPTHPKQDQWYKNSSPEFKWQYDSDIIGVSYYLDNNPSGIPGPVSDGLLSSKNYEDLADGIWYFHLKLKNSFGWGAVSNYKVQIDTVPPKQFAISFVDGKETENPCPESLFNTDDLLSGMAYYKVKVGEGAYNTIVAEVVKNDNPYLLPCQESGKKIVVVEAYDNAGNYTTSTEEVNIKLIAPPVFTDYPKQVRTDEILIATGKAAPNAKITVWLQREKDEVKSVSVKSNEDGVFTFIAGEKLKEGVYKIWAEMVDSKGARSGPSEKIIIEAVVPYFLRIGRLAIDYLTIIITLIVLLIGLLVIIGYLFYRIMLWRERMKKETKEAKNITEKAFKALVEEVEEQVANIDGNPRLSEREKNVSENLKNSLNIAKDFIEKEIKDIEDEIK